MHPLYLYSTWSDTARAAALCFVDVLLWQLATSMEVTSMDATRCSESSRDREERLRRRRERERARRTAETAEQRAHRLWQRRERDRARRALQSSERGERELQRMRATSHDRLTAETGEEREARLQQMRDCCYVCSWYNPCGSRYSDMMSSTPEISIFSTWVNPYKVEMGIYPYSGHVIKLPQDVASFANSLPRLPSELDIIVVRKEGAANTHHDFRQEGCSTSCTLVIAC